MSQVHLYLDEDAMRKALVLGLRARNVDVLTAAEAEMINRDDRDHLAAASNIRARVVHVQRGGLLHPSSSLNVRKAGSMHVHGVYYLALLSMRSSINSRALTTSVFFHRLGK